LSCEFDTLRVTLAMTARRKNLRRCEWTREMPCDWAPNQVVCAETDMPFTEAGAWEFIAQLLESEHVFQEVELKVPPGDIAYETTIKLRNDLPEIYIKIQFKKGRIWGRSFHYSLRDNKHEEESHAQQKRKSD
jgi:hypothetical protein